MIPVQDVVPSGRPPLATLALVVLNGLAFATPTLAGQLPPVAGALFGDTTLVNVVVGMWFLWLFGDNVEARLGRLTAIAIYVACGWLALHLSSATGSPPLAGMGAAGGITGILGAYFLLLPHARVLLLMPPTLAELPAVFLLGGWWLLQLFRFVAAPAAAGVLADGAAIWALAAAMLLGTIICRVMRRPVIWQ